MKKGDLVRIKDTYRLHSWEEGLHIILDVHVDDDGFPWMYINQPSGDKLWLEDYKIEVVNEAGGLDNG